MQKPLTVVICVDHASVTGGRAKVAIESAPDERRHGFRTLQVVAAAPSTSGTLVLR